MQDFPLHRFDQGLKTCVHNVGGHTNRCPTAPLRIFAVDHNARDGLGDALGESQDPNSNPS